jgi:hypothetical protein
MRYITESMDNDELAHYDRLTQWDHLPFQLPGGIQLSDTYLWNDLYHQKTMPLPHWPKCPQLDHFTLLRKCNGHFFTLKTNKKTVVTSLTLASLVFCKNKRRFDVISVTWSGQFSIFKFWKRKKTREDPEREFRKKTKKQEEITSIQWVAV